MGNQATYDRAMRDPETFWAEAAQLIDWERPWERVLDASRPPFYRWFAGAELNTCYNAVERHVAAGRGDQPAIIHDSPVTGTQTVITITGQNFGQEQGNGYVAFRNADNSSECLHTAHELCHCSC
jgi:hypothetical protein